MTNNTFQQRAEPPPPALSLDHDGWDDFELAGTHIKFQMVPSDGDRTLRVTASRELIVSSDKPNIASVSSPQQDASSTTNRVVLRPATHTFPFDIGIHGVFTGFTNIRLSEPTGELVDRVMVSVKSHVVKTYRLWRLRDIEHETKRSGEKMIAIMEKVEKLYKNQANITLVRMGEPEILFVKDKLKDPIEFPSIMNFNLAVAIQAKGKGGAGFDLVSTWKMDGRVGNTIPLNISLCSMQAYDEGLNEEMREVSTYAHEMCHAFGRWVHSSRSQVLMAGDGTDSCKFDRIDINTINPSGI